MKAKKAYLGCYFIKKLLQGNFLEAVFQPNLHFRLPYLM